MTVFQGKEMLDLRNYPTGTKVRIGRRVFSKVASGSFWREEDPIPGNCISRPSDSLQNIEYEFGAHIVIGYFVDWNGNIRRVEAPGEGYRCQVVLKTGCLGVAVIDSEGAVCYEAAYYPTLDALQAAGVPLNLAG